MDDDGWIKLHRKLLHSAVANGDPPLLAVWVHLLLRANWERRQLATGEIVEAGECIIGTSKFALEVGLTRKVVRRCLSKLEKLGNLGQKRAIKGTHITIYKWRTYQQRETDEGQKRAIDGPSMGHQRAINGPSMGHRIRREEVKKERIKEVPPISPKGDSVDVGFDSFWKVVHRRVGKDAARRAFRKAVKRVRAERGLGVQDACACVCEAMRAFADSPQAKDDVKGQLHPATWLNQGRYDDDRSCWGEGKIAINGTDIDPARLAAAAEKKARFEAVRARALFDEK